MSLIHMILMLTLLLNSGGCAALVVGAAGGAAGAVYVMGRLQEHVNYSVPIVHEATVQGLKDLDLPVNENRGDKLTAHVESESADGANIWIDLDSVNESRTKITIRVGVMGDEVRSRRILKAITARLPRGAS
jgi:hypothetical protein